MKAHYLASLLLGLSLLCTGVFGCTFMFKNDSDKSLVVIDTSETTLHTFKPGETGEIEGMVAGPALQFFQMTGLRKYQLWYTLVELECAPDDATVNIAYSDLQKGTIKNFEKYFFVSDQQSPFEEKTQLPKTEL